MRFTINNIRADTHFEYEFNKLVSKLSTVPAKVSPGFLQEVAARSNLCTSVFKIDGEYKVCARQISKISGSNLWHCGICLDMLEKIKEKEIAEHETGRSKETT
jgi:hypothetical protein